MRTIFIFLFSLFIYGTSLAQSWSLTGNAGTNPTTNFVGTTDNQRLVFRSDSVERMTILANGKVGIGTSAPQLLFHVFSSTAAQQVGISGTDPVVYFGAGSTIGASNGALGFATASNAFVSGSLAGDFVLQNNDTAHSLIFSTNQSAGNGVERMRINKIGYIGIGQASPTARLDVVCTALSGQTNPSNIRFENLQKGHGTVLVIDADGYIYKDSAGQQGQSVNPPLMTDMQGQISDLQNQVQELRSLLMTKLALSNTELKRLQNESAGFLGDVHPNPAGSSTTIDYSLPAGAGTAFCQIYTLNGGTLAAISLPASAGKSQVQVNTSQLASGLYIYALVVDGKVLDTKKLVVAH